VQRRIVRIALGVSIVSVVAPIVLTRYLPFTDAPEHAAVMATLRHWGEPSFSGPYELAVLRSQYLLFHLVGALVTALVGDAELAMRLLLALVGVALPLSFRSLLRAAGRDERLALFACLPFWSRSLVVGFLPFVASIPIAFFGLALVLRTTRRPTIKNGAALAGVALLLFYAHVSAWMVLVVAGGLVCLLRRRLVVVGALVPSVLAAGAWLALGRLTLGSGTLTDAGEISRMSVTRSLVAMPAWIFDVWRGHADELAAGAWWAAFLVAVVASARAIGRYSRRALVFLYAPFTSVLAIYLLTPWRVGAALMLNVRLAPILVLLALLPLRLPRRGALTTAALALAFVANIVGGTTALVECRKARAEIGDLDAVLAAMPEGTRLLTLNFDIRSPTTHIFPWAHVGAYHRVRSGGVASFSFSELHHWPIHYKDSERPPGKPATWDLNPCSFRNAVDGTYFDFVLVRGRVEPFRAEPPGPIFRPLVSSGAMTLYRKEPGEWPASEKTDPGPCVRAPRAGEQ
jgi:hypothetical protein